MLSDSRHKDCLPQRPLCVHYRLRGAWASMCLLCLCPVPPPLECLQLMSEKLKSGQGRHLPSTFLHANAS